MNDEMRVLKTSSRIRSEIYPLEIPEVCDLKYYEALALRRSDPDVLGIILNAFKYGYLQAQKNRG